MGLSIHQIEWLIYNREKFKGKSACLISNPFPPPRQHLEKLEKRVRGILNIEERRVLLESSRVLFAFDFLRKVLHCSEVGCVDSTSTEGANIIIDLSISLGNRDWNKRFSLVIEGGTAEHISDPAAYYKNVFTLLDVKGLYIGSVPANGWFNHGFFQFGPSLYGDFILRNAEILRLVRYSLIVGHQEISLERLWPEFSCHEFNDSYESRMCLGRFIGPFLDSVGRSNRPVMLLVVFQKVASHKNPSFGFMQREYRLQASSSHYSAPPKSIALSVKRGIRFMSSNIPMPLEFRSFMYSRLWRFSQSFVRFKA